MNMIQILKRSTIVLASMFMAAGVVGCAENDPDYASVTDSSGNEVKIIEVEAAGEVFQLSIGASGWWTAVSDSDWCYFPKSGTTTVKGDDGTELEICVAENNTGEARTANVTITSGEATYNVIVNQAAYDGYITLPSAYGEVAYDVTSASFVFSSNVTSSLKLSSSAEWVTPSRSGTTVELTIKENTTYQTRVAEITLASGDVTATYVLVQGSRDSATLSISDASYTFGADASAATAKSVDITSNISGVTYSVTSSEQWCKVTYDEATDADTFSVIVTEDNATSSNRTAIVTVVAEGSSAESIVKSISMVVVQECEGEPTLTLNSNTISAPQAGGDSSMTCYTDGTVTAFGDADWITVSVVDNILTVTTLANATSESRQGVVTVACVSGGVVVMQSIVVTQAGLGELELILSSESVDVKDDGETFTIAGYSNTAGATISYLAPSASWCTADVDTNGDVIVGSYTATQNSSLISRECTIGVMVTAGDEVLVKFVTVSQKGADATI